MTQIKSLYLFLVLLKLSKPLMAYQGLSGCQEVQRPQTAAASMLVVV